MREMPDLQSKGSIVSFHTAACGKLCFLVVIEASNTNIMCYEEICVKLLSQPVHPLWWHSLC